MKSPSEMRQVMDDLETLCLAAFKDLQMPPALFAQYMLMAYILDEPQHPDLSKGDSPEMMIADLKRCAVGTRAGL